jgi:hypothetical protein
MVALELYLIYDCAIEGKRRVLNRRGRRGRRGKTVVRVLGYDFDIGLRRRGEGSWQRILMS